MARAHALVGLFRPGANLRCIAKWTKIVKIGFALLTSAREASALSLPTPTLANLQVGLDPRLDGFEGRLLGQLCRGPPYCLFFHGLALGRLFRLFGAQLSLLLLSLSPLLGFTLRSFFCQLAFFLSFPGFFSGFLCSDFAFL
jgi:hypothetical protein